MNTLLEVLKVKKKVDTLNTNKASTTKNNGEYKKPFKI